MRRRHDALHPLTHHHHHALVAAMKLKRAGTEKNELTIEELKRDLHDFWEPGGQEHFREEEEIVLPVYSRYAKLDIAEIIQMLLEHVRIRGLVWEVLETPDDPIERMNELGQLLEAHVRLEERVVFPMIEDALPEEALHKLKPYLHSHD